MKQVIVEDDVVEYFPDKDAPHIYNCHVVNRNMHFGASVEKGEEEVIRKATAMIKSYEKFYEENPQYKK